MSHIVREKAEHRSPLFFASGFMAGVLFALGLVWFVTAILGRCITPAGAVCI